MKINIHFSSYLAQLFLEWKMFRKKNIVKKIKTHIFCSNTFPENRAVYEIMWEKILYRQTGFRL